MFFFAEDDYDDYGRDYNPCGRWRPGDADLHSFDLIREFRLDQSETLRYEGITQVQGSSSLQKAYRLQSESNLTLSSTEAFPRGTAHEHFKIKF